MLVYDQRISDDAPIFWFMLAILHEHGILNVPTQPKVQKRLGG